MSAHVAIMITPLGAVRALYHDGVILSAVGRQNIFRASHVEPDQDGAWWADLAPVAGPKLGPFKLRSAALAAESSWLEANHLPSPARSR